MHSIEEERVRLYAYIKGTIASIHPEYVVIENNGIGYYIHMPNPFAISKQVGKEATLYTYQHVREDLIALYGFQSLEEKTMFQKLLNVSGIGPKGALAILAFGEPIQVIQAIESEDDKFLMNFPGVGKKTARQMILDLKGKLHDVMPETVDLSADDKETTVQTEKMNDELEEAILALKALGY